jgi:hypothetical protein
MFCSKCGTQNPEGSSVCSNPGCGAPLASNVAGGGASGGGVDKFFDIQGEDNANLALGEARIPVPVIITILSGLCFLMYFMAMASINIAGLMSVTISGVEATFGKSVMGFEASGGNFLAIFLMIVPLALAFAALLKTPLLSEKLKLAFLDGKYYLALMALSGLGILVLIIFLIGVGNELGDTGGLAKVGPGFGWVMSLIFYLLSGAMSFFCFKGTK